MSIAGELERFYARTKQPLVLEQNGQQKFCIEQHGFEDTVVWNPGPAKAARLGYMPANEWVRMLCVEAAQVRRPVHLKPGERRLGGQTLRVIGS